jgi:hypothetical protein
LVEETQRQIRAYVEEVGAVDATLDPSSGPCWKRKRCFKRLCRRFEDQDDPIFEHMSKLMSSFEAGLFAGGSRADLPRDNLDLERWFRLPKGHERRIHGRCHAGVRIVQEGPTLLLTLDAHRHRSTPFTQKDLWPYRNAVAPECQRDAIERRKVMKRARSRKRRPLLLKELEARYVGAS